MSRKNLYLRKQKYKKNMSLSVLCENLGKKYHYEWIFRKFSFQFQHGHSYALTGNNGSGKSTLLQVISGATPPSEGRLAYELAGKKVATEDMYLYVAWAAPYMDLIEEMTLLEFLTFHQKFRVFQNKLTTQTLIEELRLEGSVHKYLKNFSSGMKQRLKLGVALYADTPLLLLDEPTNNLDAENILWYKQALQAQHTKRLIIIASNQPEEYTFCEQIIKLA